jgi:hypothetical protein
MGDIYGRYLEIHEEGGRDEEEVWITGFPPALFF